MGNHESGAKHLHFKEFDWIRFDWIRCDWRRFDSYAKSPNVGQHM